MATNPEENYLFIMHSDRDQYANELKEKIEKLVTFKKVFVSDIFSGCGTNIGPGMIGAYFIGEPISENNEKEKEALGSAIAEL